MRGRLVDIRRPSDIVGWWVDLPPRRKSFWWTLLREPGQGWLCWGIDQGRHISWDGLEVEEYFYVPPLRRAWIYLQAVAFVPKAMIVGTKHPERPGRYRWSWAEARPCTGGALWKNPARRSDLWEHDWKWDRKRARMRRREYAGR